MLTRYKEKRPSLSSVNQECWYAWVQVHWLKCYQSWCLRYPLFFKEVGAAQMDPQMTGMPWKVCGVTDLISITNCIKFFPVTISNKITLSGLSVALQWPFQTTGLSPGVSAVKELTLEICLWLLINFVLSNSIRPPSGSLGDHSLHLLPPVPHIGNDT